MVYKKYTWLQEGTNYQFLNCEDEIVVHRYLGFYYCEDWRENAILLGNPANGDLEEEWPASCFEGAVDIGCDPEQLREQEYYF